MDSFLSHDQKILQLAKEVRNLYEVEKERPALRLHGWSHTWRVTKNAFYIAQDVHMNISIGNTIAAAITHDIGYLSNPANHVKASASMAEDILKRHGFSFEEIRAITNIILSHSPKIRSPESAEDRILYVADKCDLIGFDGTMRCIMEIGDDFHDRDFLARSLLNMGKKLVKALHNAGEGRKLVDKKWQETQDFLNTVVSRSPSAIE